jgi:hypothetical protein
LVHFTKYSSRYSHGVHWIKTLHVTPNQALPFATSPTLSPVGFGNGNEWEIRTYIHINVGKIKIQNEK